MASVIARRHEVTVENEVRSKIQDWNGEFFEALIGNLVEDETPGGAAQRYWQQLSKMVSGYHLIEGGPGMVEMKSAVAEDIGHYLCDVIIESLERKVKEEKQRARYYQSQG